MFNNRPRTSQLWYATIAQAVSHGRRDGRFSL